MPFSDFKNQLANSDIEDIGVGPKGETALQFNSTKKSNNLRLSFLQGQINRRGNDTLDTVASKDDDEVIIGEDQPH